MVYTRVGTTSVVGDGHRPIAVQSDDTPPKAIGHRFVGRISEHLQHQMHQTGGSKDPWLPMNLLKVIDVRTVRPLVCRGLPASRFVFHPSILAGTTTPNRAAT